jgi:hypothetical protein
MVAAAQDLHIAGLGLWVVLAEVVEAESVLEKMELLEQPTLAVAVAHQLALVDLELL